MSLIVQHSSFKPARHVVNSFGIQPPIRSVWDENKQVKDNFEMFF